MSESDVKGFADALVNAKRTVHPCSVCQNLTELDVCFICDDDRRDKSIICVVESPKDVTAFERTREYKGSYHVLHGLISPIDGVTPDSLRIKELLKRINDGNVSEIIMATNPTVEGEATAMYIARLLKPLGVKVTRLAFGLPVGGILEYADEVTLFRALENRSEM
ncbi:MAG TPA: recombination protein RecR [Clostridiales bacterium]|nr:recombination protein RecR [Clostridiales bacterium]